MGTRRLWLVALAVALAACGDRGSEPGRTVDADAVPDDAATDAQPFRVGKVPSHFTDWTAGPGTSRQMWGWECCGSHEPFTVLAPRNTDKVAERDLVVVAVTGGGFDESHSHHMGRGDTDEFRVDERDATYAANDDWREIVVDAGEGVAVRVTAAGRSRESLADIYRRVTVRGHDAPVVNPPDDLDVVGKVSADFVVAVSTGPTNNEIPPGPAGGLSAVWKASNEDYLMVVSLPSDAADLDALAGWPLVVRGDAKHLEIEGRPAARLQGGTIVARAPWGGVIVVAGRGDWATEAELSRIAESIEAVDSATWERFLGGPNGGPALRPDAGRFEIARGQANGLEWLLQGGPKDDVDRMRGGSESMDGTMAEECLKLLRQRVCATSTFSSPDGSTVHLSDAARRFGESVSDLPGFAIVTTEFDADTLRVVTSGGSATEGPLHLLRGQPVRRAGIAFGSGITGFPVCRDDPPRSGGIRVELIKNGQMVSCLGSS